MRRTEFNARFLVVSLIFVASVGCTAVDPDTLAERYEVSVYNPDKVFQGTTIFGDTSRSSGPVIVEVDLHGKVVWFYEIPGSIVARGRASSGLDVEWIPKSNNILFVFPRVGVYEVNRKKEIVWSYIAPVSHDADRLPGGNTLMAWAWGDDSSNPEAREVDPSGKIVWEWRAKEHLSGYLPVRTDQGYTHTNAVVRLSNGNTLVSLRNFDTLVEVNRSGNIVWALKNLAKNPHDPEELSNGNILVNTRGPQVIREYDRTGKVVWEHYPKGARVIRYNHKLPNGNIIFAERTNIVEMTPDGEVVWRLILKGVGRGKKSSGSWFYKAERIPSQ